MDVLVSGGFDPLHIGHLKYLKAARALAPADGRLIVCLNSDLWLQQKKGYVFMPSDERKAILQELRCVSKVWVQEWDGPDMGPALRYWTPDIFAKGGDRRSIDDLPREEIIVCLERGIKVVFGVGGFDKPASSSELVRRATVAQH